MVEEDLLPGLYHRRQVCIACWHMHSWSARRAYGGTAKKGTTGRDVREIEVERHA